MAIIYSIYARNIERQGNWERKKVVSGIDRVGNYTGIPNYILKRHLRDELTPNPKEKLKDTVEAFEYQIIKNKN